MITESKDLNGVSKALQAGVPRVSVHLMDNRETRSLQSEAFFLHFPLLKVFLEFLCFAEAAILSSNCSPGEGRVCRAQGTRLGGVRGRSHPKCLTPRRVKRQGLRYGQSPPEQRWRAEGSLPADEEDWKRVVLQCVILLE